MRRYAAGTFSIGWMMKPLLPTPVLHSAVLRLRRALLSSRLLVFRNGPIGQNPHTGEPEREGGTQTTYWPAPVHRKPPEWLNEITLHDRTLATVLSEMYTALNNDLRILAAIGARTTFDRASHLLGVDSNLSFDRKLDSLVALGKVSTNTERNTASIGRCRKRSCAPCLGAQTSGTRNDDGDPGGAPASRVHFG